MLGLGSLVPSQDIGYEERLRNDLFCVEWDVKPELNQSTNQLVWQCNVSISTSQGIGRMALVNGMTHN